MTLKNKRLSIALLTLLMLAAVWTAPALAAEFFADSLITGGGMEVSGKFYVKGDWVRQERKMPQAGDLIMILNTRTLQAYVVLPMAQMYSEIQVPKGSLAQGNLGWQGEKSLPPGTQKVGSEKISGLDCNVYTYNNAKEQVQGKAWISTRLDFPIQAEGTTAQGPFSYKLENIRIGSVSDSLMKPPEGFRAMQIPPAMLQALLGGGK